MDSQELIQEAEAARLELWIQESELVIRGPRQAEHLVRRLAAHQAEVIAELRTDWCGDAHRVIDALPDAALRTLLYTYFDEVVEMLRVKQEMTMRAAEMQAFGLLLFRLLQLNIDGQLVSEESST